MTIPKAGQAALGIPDETEDLTKTLVHTLAVIAACDPASRQRIADAYQDARNLVRAMAGDSAEARPRIVACLERFEIHRRAGDEAAAGWMLAAVIERLDERNLRGWRKLRRVADKAFLILPPASSTTLN